MKFFKDILIIAIISFITSIDAKVMKRATPAQPNTFIELVNFVKTAPNIWDTNTPALSEQFIDTLKKGAQTAKLEKSQFNILVDMASYHAPFSGNTEQDKKIANIYAGQKEDILQDYGALTAPETKSLQEKLASEEEQPAQLSESE